MSEYRVRILPDDSFDVNGFTDVESLEVETRNKLASGEWSVYVIVVERLCDMDEWHHVDSMGGTVVESSNQDGTYSPGVPDETALITDDYLRDTVREMLSGAQEELDGTSGQDREFYADDQGRESCA